MNTPFILVIFGATGDLTAHKLIPALFALFIKGQLPKEFTIIGFARRALRDKEFQELFIQNHPQWKQFAKHLSYHQGDFNDNQAYTQLVEKLATLSPDATRIFYLATPPQYYDTILEFLYINRKFLSQKIPQVNKKLARLAIEKPFGKDLMTAQMLDKKLANYFEEWQVFRVDHYLGKETVQNLLIFRFANGLFEPVWNATYIDHVQITFAEKNGIGKRGKFYDGVGELRDIAQNHLMQLIAAVAMDMPKNFSQEGVREARAHALAAIECIEPSAVAKQVVRGQYQGYTQGKDVDPNSTTETFVAMKFFSNNPRFTGVPFYVRAGKALKENEVKISVVFRQTCHMLFKEIGCPEEGNVLTFRIQPKEGISLQLIAKTPGTKLDLQPVDMHFSYDEQFKTRGSDAYEKILVDILMGDQMLFNRSDELASSWRFITNILTGWNEKKTPIYSYEEGSWGPKEADTLIEKDNRKWL